MRNYKIVGETTITIQTTTSPMLQEGDSRTFNRDSEIIIIQDNSTAGRMVLAIPAGIAKIQPKVTNHQQLSATGWEETILAVIQHAHVDLITRIGPKIITNRDILLKTTTTDSDLNLKHFLHI